MFEAIYRLGMYMKEDGFMDNRHNANRKNNKQQETIRRILLSVIFILAMCILFVLIIIIKNNSSCISPASNKPLPSDSYIGFIITSLPTQAVETPTAPPDVDPTEVEGTPIVSPTATTTGDIPRSLTVGTMEDVLNRLEELKTLNSGERIILIDVGHGGFDGGTVGIDTNVTEARLNLEVARRISDKLAEKGCYVLLTRMGDYALAKSKNADMAERKRIMQLDLFDCCVSIHMNALDGDRSVRGLRCYHYKNGTEGAKLAATVLKAVRDMTDETRTNTYTGNIMVVREPVAPSTLIECGFLSNSQDEMRLQDPAYQDVLAQAIANGIDNYLNGNTTY